MLLYRINTKHINKNPFLVDTVKTKLFLEKKIVSIFKYSLIFYKYPNDLTVNNSVIDVI